MPELGSTVHRQFDRTPHLVVAGVCLLMVAAAATLALVGQVQDGRLEVAGRPLPGVCTFKNLTGIPCAGCGLTRSWVELLSGHLEASIGYNRVGWLVFAYVVLQILRHGAWLAIALMRPGLDRVGRWLDWGLAPLVAVLLVSWGVNLIRM